jgi:hypothetical protein
MTFTPRFCMMWWSSISIGSPQRRPSSRARTATQPPDIFIFIVRVLSSRDHRIEVDRIDCA